MSRLELIRIGKTDYVYNKKPDEELGHMDRQWGKPVFCPNEDMVFTQDCLMEIIEMLEIRK